MSLALALVIGGLAAAAVSAVAFYLFDRPLLGAFTLILAVGLIVPGALVRSSDGAENFAASCSEDDGMVYRVSATPVSVPPSGSDLEYRYECRDGDRVLDVLYTFEEIDNSDPVVMVDGTGDTD